MSNFFKFLNWIWDINNIDPKTRTILDMLDPTTFPNDKFGEFSNTAFIETNNSGSEVPNPIIIKPIKKSETLNFFPNAIALDSKTSAPFTTK